MHLTLRQLSVFETFARTGGFTNAAKELHLTQPAVSLQVKQLEENIGLPLYERTGKKILLTEAGREILIYAESISSQLKELESVINEMKGMERGRLNIAIASTANYFAPKLLATFNRRFENVDVYLDVTNREGLIEHLVNNDTDMVIMGRPPDDLKLEFNAFLDNPLVIIAASDHHLAKETHISLERLDSEKFVIRECGSGTRIAIERFFNRQQVSLVTGMEMSSNEAIKQAVEAGLGLGIVSIHTLRLELEANKLVVLDIESFPIMRHWYIVYRSGKRLSPVAKAFSEFVINEAGEILGIPKFSGIGPQ